MRISGSYFRENLKFTSSTIRKIHRMWLKMIICNIYIKNHLKQLTNKLNLIKFFYKDLLFLNVFYFVILFVVAKYLHTFLYINL